MQRSRVLGLTLLGVGGVAAAGFTLLARAVVRRETSHADGRVRRRLPKRRRRATKKAATAIGPLGKEWAHAPIALAVSAYAWRRGAGVAAIAVPLASAAGTGLSRTFDRYMPHRSPPPGRHAPTTPSFPSGHSLETMAVGVTSAYVLAREGILPVAAAAPIALVVPVVSGLGRMYLDRHWGTDVVAGWLAGVALAAGCASLYEGLRE